MAAVFKAIRQINRLLDDRQISSGDARKLVAVFRDIDTVLKIFDFSPPAPDSEVARLVERRRSARRAGNFEEADRIREELLKRGVAVHDEKIERSE
jgi:cysteinyl-tRNA synthetase